MIDYKKILNCTGRISQAGRLITGGPDFTTGFTRNPCQIDQISQLVIELRKLLDEYDDLIIQSVEDKKCLDV